MLFYTVCHINRLPEAIVLGNSIKAHHPESSYFIGLLDKKDRIADLSNIKYPLVEVDELGITDFEKMCQQYTWDELAANCKPFFARYFLQQSDKVVYLDCTSLVYSTFNFVEQQLIENNILLIPQLLHAGKHPDEKQILNTGIFHSGFFALKNTAESFRFLDWWANNTAQKGFTELCKGLNADQLWLEHVPALYDGVHILKHDGLNIGYWNLPERTIDASRSKANGQQIVSVNFKGMKYWPEYKRQISSYNLPVMAPIYGKPNPKVKKNAQLIANNIRKINSFIDKIIDQI
ncbi:hypothetical protein [Emticicia sp. 17c]|uniref:hypothetical protein n=1 Tax=Emticicia sp. 17c TaxID=3127704 RepID=UPI00301D0B83